MNERMSHPSNRRTMVFTEEGGGPLAKGKRRRRRWGVGIVWSGAFPPFPGEAVGWEKQDDSMGTTSIYNVAHKMQFPV